MAKVGPGACGAGESVLAATGSEDGHLIGVPTGSASPCSEPPQFLPSDPYPLCGTSASRKGRLWGPKGFATLNLEVPQLNLLWA